MNYFFSFSVSLFWSLTKSFSFRKMAIAAVKLLDLISSILFWRDDWILSKLKLEHNMSFKLWAEIRFSSMLSTSFSTNSLLLMNFRMICLAWLWFKSSKSSLVFLSPYIIEENLLESSFKLKCSESCFGSLKCLRSVTKWTPFSANKEAHLSKFNLYRYSKIVISAELVWSLNMSFAFWTYILGSSLWVKKWP
jgi:hypothetical protein